MHGPHPHTGYFKATLYGGRCQGPRSPVPRNSSAIGPALSFTRILINQPTPKEVPVYTQNRPSGRKPSNPDSRVANMYVPIDTLKKRDAIADRIGAGRGMAITQLFADLEALAPG